MGSPNGSQFLFLRVDRRKRRARKHLNPLRKPSQLSWRNGQPTMKALISQPFESLRLIKNKEAALLISPIQPGQRLTENSTPASWKVSQESLEEYERDRVGKYAPYFQGNVILPIPEISEALDPCIILLIVVDIKTRGFAELKKDTFGELMRTAGIPGQYFCRESFATWDVLLPTKEQAAKLAESCISMKFF